MDQGRHRSGPGHRIRQPDMERKLGRLAAGANKKPQRNPRQDAPVAQSFNGKAGGPRHHFGVLRSSKRTDYAEDGENETKVTNAISDKRFARGVGRLVAIEVVPDQKIRAETDTLPAY